MPSIHSIAVFCGARAGHDPVYAEAARDLGTGLAQAGIRLVFGGGRVGIMGIVADAVLAGGGSVLGVIPDFLTKWEVAHPGVTEMAITDSMHTRKRRMFDESDAFVTMPGGLGTLDETFEIITWRQLRLHQKPILICDVAGSAQPLLALIEAAIASGFTEPESRSYFEVVNGVPALLQRLAALPANAEALSGRL